MGCQSWLCCPNFVVNYPLVVSYSQHCHIGNNINYWCVIIISINVMFCFFCFFFCIFSCRTSNNFYKLLVIIVIYNKKNNNKQKIKNKKQTKKTTLRQNVTVFLPKTFQSFSKCMKNWKRVGICIWELLEDYHLEAIQM